VKAVLIRRMSVTATTGQLMAEMVTVEAVTNMLHCADADCVDMENQLPIPFRQTLVRQDAVAARVYVPVCCKLQSALGRRRG